MFNLQRSVARKLIATKCSASIIGEGHHVNALCGLDRRSVKTVSPAERGRSDAESLDGAEASPRMSDVMARIDGGQQSENISASMGERHGDPGPTRGLQVRADRIDAAERRWDARASGRVRSDG